MFHRLKHILWHAKNLKHCISISYNFFQGHKRKEKNHKKERFSTLIMFNRLTIKAMKTLINANKVTLNFNLREPKKVNGSTNLYAVVKVEGKQLKISLGCKVCAWNWDAKKQVPIVKDGMNQQDIANALQINEIINDVRSRFFLYLCSGDTITETTIKEVLTIETQKDMANKNAIPPQRTKTATKLLEEAFETRYGLLEAPKCAPSSYKAYTYQLKRFLEYLKQPNVYDSAKSLTNKTIYNYKAYLEAEAEKKGAGTYNVIVKQCNLIILLINDIAANPNFERLELVHIEPLKEKKVIKKAETKKRELTAAEINAVVNVELHDKRLEFYRDCFIMQINSGVRVSDLPKLFKREYKTIEEDGKQLIQIVSKKETITAVIICNDTIKALINKYADGLPYNFTKNAYNNALKVIFMRANLTHEETFSQEINGVKKEVKERLCDIISSHFARHTFITQRLREGWSFEKVCYLTGHANDVQIRLVYEHLTEKDKAQQVIKELGKIEQKQDKTNNTQSNEIEKLINECKDVLMMLGANYGEIADINDLDTLLVKIYVDYHKRFEDCGISAMQLKEIYNTKPTFKEKQIALQTLICEAKAKKILK